MEKFIIHGSRPLKGQLEVRGAKNAAFPLLAATILCKKDCIIENLPLIEDVFRMIEILESMGAKVQWKGERIVSISTRHLDPSAMDNNLVRRFRGSVLFMGPLLSRFGKVFLPVPGGDIIGARPIYTHLDAFSQLGAHIISKGNGFEVSFKKRPRAAEVVLKEFSVTATENLMLFGGLHPYPLRIKIADQDYQVQELLKVLTGMGCRATFSDPHTIDVQGRKELKAFRHKLLYDPIEAGTFLLLAIGTKGRITIKNVELKFLDLLFKTLKDSGARFDIKKRKDLGEITVAPFKKLVIEKIQSFIYPGISSDLQSSFGVLATQAEGPTLLHDPLYEGRLKYLEELNKMGAHIYVADPHRAIINGPTKLRGAELGTADIRGGAALIMASLMAQGKSTLNNIYQIDRGYEKIEERLQHIGADIQRA